MTIARLRPVPDPRSLEGLIGWWRNSLRAERKSPKTIRSYTDSAHLFAVFARDHLAIASAGDIDRRHVEAFIGDQLARHKPTTAAVRYRSLQQFFRWLAEEDEIPRNPMANMRPPRMPEEPVPIISDGDLKLLLSYCAGKTFDQRRDRAIIRLFVDTGMRLGELTGIALDDIDWASEMVVVTGKGDRKRAVPFGTKTVLDLNRYLRVRQEHRYADEPWLWLGQKGKMTESGIAQMIARHAEQAGLKIHPHQFRHGFAHQWKEEGGSDEDLMRLMGWRSDQMLRRYGSALADERAIQARKRLTLGDRL